MALDSDGTGPDLQPSGAPSPTSFANRVVDRSELPALPDDAFQPVERAHLSAQLGILAVVVGVAVLASSAVAIAGPRPMFAVGAVIAVIGALTAWAMSVAFRHRGWLIREHDISYRSGVISRTVETVPFSRVQHTAVDAGPIDRSLGLAKLSVYSASGGGADIVISGLRHDDAVRLRERVSAAAASS